MTITMYTDNKLYTVVTFLFKSSLYMYSVLCCFRHFLFLLLYSYYLLPKFQYFCFSRAFIIFFPGYSIRLPLIRGGQILGI